MGDQLQIGSKTSTGQIVSEILGQSQTAAVYITEDKSLRWSYFGDDGIVPNFKKPALSEFDGLMQTINTHLPVRHREEHFRLLGKSLFQALDTTELGTSHCYFESVNKSIEELAQQNARFSYVSYCFVAFGLILAIALFVSWVFSFSGAWLIGQRCGLMGAAGAAISVAHRITGLKINWKSQRTMLAAEGMARILVGFFFGILFYLMCTGDLVLGVFKENSIAFMVFATVAGFSERFIPELMKKLEARA